MNFSAGTRLHKKSVTGEVTGVASYTNGVEVESFAYSYDALGRPVSRNPDTFGYNDRHGRTTSMVC